MPLRPAGGMACGWDAFGVHWWNGHFSGFTAGVYCFTTGGFLDGVWLEREGAAMATGMVVITDAFWTYMTSMSATCLLLCSVLYSISLRDFVWLLRGNAMPCCSAYPAWAEGRRLTGDTAGIPFSTAARAYISHKEGSATSSAETCLLSTVRGRAEWDLAVDGTRCTVNALEDDVVYTLHR